jgi:hypothetical protein
MLQLTSGATKNSRSTTRSTQGSKGRTFDITYSARAGCMKLLITLRDFDWLTFALTPVKNE